MSLETSRVVEVAEFREALRRFLRQSERVARQSGLTPQRHLLLLMIRGAPDGSGQSTVTGTKFRARSRRGRGRRRLRMEGLLLWLPPFYVPGLS